MTEDCTNYRESLKWVDMTPNSSLPTRILSAYLDYCECTDNTIGEPPTNPLIIKVNELRIKRNKILEKAIKKLKP